MIGAWCEVWIDLGLEPPRLLLVMPSECGRVIVRDPQEGAVAFEGRDYEAVKLWLLEDEYTRVDGRMNEEKS